MRWLALLLCALLAAPVEAAAKKKKPAAAKKAPPKPPPEPEPAPAPPAKKSTVLLDTNPAALAVQLEQALSQSFAVAAADTALPEDIDRDAVMRAAGKARAVAVVTARYQNKVWVVRTWSGADGGVLAEATFKAPVEGPKAVVPKPILAKLVAGAVKAESAAAQAGAQETAAGSGPKEKRPADTAKPKEPAPAQKEKEKEPEPAKEAAAPAAAESGEKPKALHLGVGMPLTDRRFFYNVDLFGALSRYRQPLAPRIGFELELFPAAFATGGPASWFGITASFDFLIAVRAVAADGTAFPTSSLRLKLNGGARIPIADRLELGVTFGYALTTYGIVGTDKPNVPDVAYSALRPAASVAVRLFGPVWVKAAGGYQIVLNAGQIQSAEFFPRSTVGGMDVEAGALVRPFRFLEVRAAYTYQRYWFTMNPEPGDPYIAGGALDDSRGLSVFAAFTL